MHPRGRDAVTPEEIARRFSTLRPATRLVSYQEVGLPLWELNLRVLTLAHRKLPPLEEFALKSVDAGLPTVKAVASFLGIGETVTSTTFAELVAMELLEPREPAEDVTPFALTTAGLRSLQDLYELAPEQRHYPFLYDGLTRRLVLLGNVPLYTRGELRGEGIQEIPAFPGRPPTVDELPIADVGTLMNQLASPTEVQRDVLAIMGIEGNRRWLFQRSVALIFESLEGLGVQVVFVVDGRVADEHSAAFAAAEGVRKLGIQQALRQTSEEVASTVLSPSIVQQAAPESEVESLRRSSAVLHEVVDELSEKLRTTESEPEREALLNQALDATQHLTTIESALQQLPVRALAVYEHPPLLQSAFAEAADRLLIVSPWLRNAVIDGAFLKALEDCLVRGVHVYIGYGTGQEQFNQSDSKAEGALQALAKTRPNFFLARLGDIHAKVLLVDDKFVVVTSFNWLSFRGDPNKPFRDERGLMVRISQTIDQLFSDFHKRIVDSRYATA